MMKISFPPALWLVRLFAVLVLPSGAFAQEKFGWEPKEIGGDEYLPVEKISRFYGFEDPRKTGKEVMLDNKKIKLQLEVDSSECLMNGIKFVFEKPVKEVDAAVYVSRKDLSRVLDPVMRPAFIKHPAILIKGGCLTHDYEAKLIHNEAFQRFLAKAIVAGVSKYRDAVGPKP